MYSRKCSTVCWTLLIKCSVSLGILFFSAVSCNAREVADKKWFVCSRDSQCTVIKGPCQEAVDVNSDFSASAQSYYEQMAALVECDRVENFHLDQYAAVCAVNKCVLKQTDKVGK